MEQGVSWEASEGSAPPALPRASTEQPSQRKQTWNPGVQVHRGIWKGEAIVAAAGVRSETRG